MPLPALVVGCGAMGAQFDAHAPRADKVLTHAHACRESDLTRLVAGVDVDESNREAFETAWDCPAYETLDAAAASHDFDIVCVATPAGLHEQHVSEALDHDIRGVLCEKPLAPQSDSAERIVDQCDEHDVHLAVNYIRRYVPEIRDLADSLQTGAYGTVDSAVFTYTKGLFENGSHMVDLARWWFGPDVSVDRSDSAGVDATLRYAGTDCRLVGTGSEQYSSTRVDIYTESGAIRLVDNGRVLVEETVASDPVYPGFDHLTEHSRRTTDLYRATFHAVENLAAALTEGDSLYCSGRDGSETVRLCERIDAA